MKKKNKIWIVVAIIAVLILGKVIYTFYPIITSKKITDLKSMEYRVSSWGSKTYMVNCTDTCYIKNTEIDKSKLIGVLNKYYVSSWNGFNKKDTNWSDGTGFFLHVVMDDSHDITAEGYMKFPRNYFKFSKEILDLLGEDNYTE